MRYSLKSGQDLTVLSVLLARSDAQWALQGVPVTSLPWRLAGLRPPAILGVDASWDINSRSVVVSD